MRCEKSASKSKRTKKTAVSSVNVLPVRSTKQRGAPWEPRLACRVVWILEIISVTSLECVIWVANPRAVSRVQAKDPHVDLSHNISLRVILADARATQVELARVIPYRLRRGHLRQVVCIANRHMKKCYKNRRGLFLIRHKNIRGLTRMLKQRALLKRCRRLLLSCLPRPWQPSQSNDLSWKSLARTTATPASASTSTPPPALKPQPQQRAFSLNRVALNLVRTA